MRHKHYNTLHYLPLVTWLFCVRVSEMAKREKLYPMPVIPPQGKTAQTHFPVGENLTKTTFPAGSYSQGENFSCYTGLYFSFPPS